VVGVTAVPPNTPTGKKARAQCGTGTVTTGGKWVLGRESKPRKGFVRVLKVGAKAIHQGVLGPRYPGSTQKTGTNVWVCRPAPERGSLVGHLLVPVG